MTNPIIAAIITTPIIIGIHFAKSNPALATSVTPLTTSEPKSLTSLATSDPNFCALSAAFLKLSPPSCKPVFKTSFNALIYSALTPAKPLFSAARASINSASA